MRDHPDTLRRKRGIISKAEVATGTRDKAASSRWKSARNPQLGRDADGASLGELLRIPRPNASRCARDRMRRHRNRTAQCLQRAVDHGEVERGRIADIALDARETRIEHQNASGAWSFISVIALQQNSPSALVILSTSFRLQILSRPRLRRH